MNTTRLVAALILSLPFAASSQVVINELQFDDTGTDDREFVELFNNGVGPVDISGWVLTGRDVTTQNPSFTIPGAVGSGTTMLAAGGYYVFGNTGTLNVNQIVAANAFENDNEVIELYNGPIGGGGVLLDAFSYETNKGANWGSPANLATVAAVIAQTGVGYFGNHQGIDLAGNPLNSTVSLGRFIDGRDTNNNGRDFGLRPSTPGTTNAPGGLITSFVLNDPASLTVGSTLTSVTGSFVDARVIDPTIVDGTNPNFIPAPYGPGSKAFVAWDPSGGGNSVTSKAVFSSSQSGFSVRVYLDTADLPVQSNATGVQFRGSEITVYGIGSGDALTNLVDISGSVGLSGATPPLAETANGFTGYAWLYERVGLQPGGGTAVSEFLYLVDANDGGDAQIGGNTPLDWTVLTAIDLSLTPSGWHDLTISIDGAGNGLGSFDGTSVPFTAAGFNSGAFNIGYRENLQIGADGTPDALMRPATFTIVPEPSTSLLLLGALVPVLARRRASSHRSAAR